MIILHNDLSLFNYSEVRREVQNKEKKLEDSFGDFKKKDLGIYYTPQFIVKYIVDTALSLSLASKLTKIEKEQEAIFQDLKTRREVTETKHAALLINQILPNFSICDISMGWGVFLLYSFDYLIHLYMSSFKLLEEDLSKFLPRKSTSEEDIKYHAVLNIISNNLFGVDIAKDSVELAVFKTIEKAIQILKKDEIRLPRPNYYVGNCLIGHITRDFKIDKKNSNDIYTKSILNSINKNERVIVKDWLGKTDMVHWPLCFPKIFESGGFDVIVGNPPYINVKKINLGERRAYSRLYKTYNPNGDISNVFWERGLKLCKDSGIISFITPRYWLEGSHSNSLRNFILRNSTIKEIIDFRSNRSLFTQTEKKLGVDTAIVTLQRDKAANNIVDVYLSTNDSPIIKIRKDNFKHFTTFQKTLSEKKWIFEKHPIIDEIRDRAKFRLGDDKKNQNFTGICEIGKGCSTGNNRIFQLKEQTPSIYEGAEGENLFLEKHEKRILHRLIKSSDIRRYWWRQRDQYWIFLKDEKVENYTNIKNYLEKYKSVLEKTKRKYKLKNYYDYAAYRSLPLINHSPKIICPYQSNKNRFVLLKDDKLRTIYEADVITIILKESYTRTFDWYYMLAVLNSEIINYYTRLMNKKVYNLIDFRTNQLSPIPIMQCENQQTIKHFVKNLLALISLKQQKNENLLLQGIKLHKDILNYLIFETYLREELETSLMSVLEADMKDLFLFDIPEESILTKNNQLTDLIMNDRDIKNNIKKIINHPEVKRIKRFLALK
jgi:hypothetical protein